MSKIQIDWSVLGRVFINDKFSHAVSIELDWQNIPCSVSSWDKCSKVSGGTGTMLGTFNEKTIKDIIQAVESECLRIAAEGCENLRTLRIKNKEYPFRYFREKKNE